uniref:TGF-beta family profile domain-containing protein n=1 Tax=Scleropages formosus TaxID=113540 RepID=A0A8C9S3W0_SCLFO
MLHIDKLSVPRRSQPHPYMTHVYRLLDSREVHDASASDGTLVQSFRSYRYGPPGWIWFSVIQLEPYMAAAELVLRRRTLHPEPLSVSVAVHAVVPTAGQMVVSAPLDEQLLVLDRPPPLGYDVFDVSVALAGVQGGPVGFQLRYTDESGSLVLHEALTQSLYCLNGSAHSEPLLVVYQLGQGHPMPHPSPKPVPPGPKRGQRHHSRMVQVEARCTLYQHYVDLRPVADWVLHPQGFNLSSCRWGNAERTVPVQLTVPLASRSYCIPQELSALTVMYMSSRGDISIAQLSDMMAGSCVCGKDVRRG